VHWRCGSSGKKASFSPGPRLWPSWSIAVSCTYELNPNKAAAYASYWWKRPFLAEAVLNDLPQNLSGEVLFIQEGDGTRFQAKAMELTIGVSADENDTSIGVLGLEAPGAADAVLVAQHDIHQNQ
jgi:hypothetical protein